VAQPILAPAIEAASVRRRPGRLARIEATAGYLFILPWLLGFVIFLAGPMIASLYFSLTHYELVKPPEWIGLQNYLSAFSDPLVWQSLKVSAVYSVVVVPLGMIFSFLVALLLNQSVKGLSIFRSIYYLPVLIPAAVSSVLFGWLFNPDFGLVNAALSFVGIKGPLWFASTTWALPGLMILNLWSIGGPMLIYLAGFQGIPTDLYEAASIDGAGVLNRFRHVTIPMVTPVIFFNLIMGIIGSFQSFTSAYVLTAGGPVNSTLFYVLYLYENAFQNFRMGYASALAWILFVIVLLLSLLVFRSSSAWVYYEGQVEAK
jgi:multiple sugar transport system permease protein